MHGLSRIALSPSIVAATSMAEAAASSKPSDFPEAARNMRLVAHDDLQGRTAYQVVPHEQGGKWYLYIGHLPGTMLNPATGSGFLYSACYRQDARARTRQLREQHRPIVHTDNVEVDERGTYPYAVDRANTGLHVLELPGDAKRIADSK